MRTRIDRAPIRFYLEHRERIEEWAALRVEVDAYTKQLLNEIGAEMAADGAALYQETEVSYPAAVLYRPHWKAEASKPSVGVGLGWGSKPNLRRPDSSHGPWWGVWHGETTKDDPLPIALRVRLRLAAETIGLKSGGIWSWWPLWTLVAPAPVDWYDNLESLTVSLHQRVETAWETLADPIESVLLEAQRE